MSTLLSRRWLRVTCRLVLGLAFVYAAVFKIADPPNFAKEVFAYKMLPGALLNLFALYLPWVELVAGAALVLGVGSRGGAALAGSMLVMFMAAIFFRAVIRGDHHFECGCFPDAPGWIDGLPVVGAVKAFLLTSKDPWVTFGRDALFLAMAAVVLRGPAPASSPDRAA